MKTQKEIEAKIKEIKELFFDGAEKFGFNYSLRYFRIQLNVLRWVLGEKQWVKQADKKENGARIR